VLVDVAQILHRGLLRRVGSVNHKTTRSSA
jgi:hypothetical protein